MRKLLVVCACATAVSCGRTADVSSGLRVQLVNTGWRDAGRVDGRNKLVPSAAVKVTNVSNQKLPSVQLNAVFHRVGDRGEWGTAFASATGSGALTPGGGATVTLQSGLGYTGDDPTDAMLTNAAFVDVTVDVFAKYGSRQWARLGAFPIDRQLLR